MKTLLYRVMISSLAVAGLTLVAGCEEEVANADVPTFTANELKTNPPVALEQGLPSDLSDSDEAEESEKASPPARVVDKAVIPEGLKVSPALEEIIKLIQAGISEEVIMTYVTNSTNFFNVGSDEIVYLNDLGVDKTVVTALIQHDSSPEMLARKNAVATAKPLPPGVALTTPASNVYPGGATVTPPAETALPPSYEETAPATATVTYEQAPANVSYFYSNLAPYGSWVEVPDYGLCWQPTVAVVNRSWRPYCDSGRWLWSDSGWYWYSDYSWGWAPFHYGRWATYPRLGWVWVPDTCWGPSWVSWRYNNSYCGWAPLPPGCNYVSGFGLYYHSRSVSIGFDFGLGSSCWTYIPLNRFCDRRPHLYYASRSHASRLHRETTIVNNYIVGNNNTIVNNGVGRDRVARVTRGEIPRAAIRDGALTTQNARRPERLERTDSTLVVTRPQLPKQPPVQPRVVAAKFSPEPSKPPGANAANLSPARNNSAQPTASRAPRLTEQQLVRPGLPQSDTGGSRSVRSRPDSDSAKSSPAASSAHRGRKAESPEAVVTTPAPKPETPASVAKPARNPNAAVIRPAPATGVLRNSSVNTAPSQPSASPSATVRQAESGRAEARTGNPSGRQGQSIARPPFQSTPGAPAYGRPANVAPAVRPQNSTAAPARQERYRIYADPPAASRSASPVPQAAGPQFSRPSGITTPLPAPVARPNFEAPRSAAPAPHFEHVRPSAPVVRSEPARSAAPTPSQSGSSGRSHAPAQSGGGKSDDRGGRK